MRILSADALEALDSGRFAVRSLLKVSLLTSPADPFCIWDDLGTLEVDGDIYEGKAGRFTLEASVSTQDLTIRSLDITLSSLDSEVAALIDAQPWHQAPVLIQRAIIATELPAVLHVHPEFAGALDQMFWREGADGTAELVFRCESASRELSRTGVRTRSDADQRQRDSLDGFYTFASTAINTTIDWGRTPEKPKKGGLSGLIDKIF